MNFVNLLLFLFVSAQAHAKISDPFTFGVLGKVCIGRNPCQRYSHLGQAQIDLQEVQPNEYYGEAKITYTVEHIEFVSTFQVSEFSFHGKRQINIFVQTRLAGDDTNLGSAEVVTADIKRLNSVVQYSAPITRPNLRIEPATIIGPDLLSLQRTVRSLIK